MSSCLWLQAPAGQACKPRECLLHARVPVHMTTALAVLLGLRYPQ